MKPLNLGWMVALAVVMIGCQGQNPFDRNSNPVQDYPNVTASANQKYVPGQKPVVPPEPDNTQVVWYEPFKVAVDNDRGSKLLTFTEDTESSYQIQVRSFLGDSFKIEPVGLPAGASFSEVSRDHNTAVYRLTWKPPRTRNLQADISTFSLRYQAGFAQRCGQDIREQLNLLVMKTAGEPTITYFQFPQNEIKFGDSFDFQVEVNDPASSAQVGPDLGRPTFEAWMTNSEHTVLDASPAVDCQSAGKYVGGTKWRFTCKFNSNLINGVKNYLNSGKSVDSSFFFVASSKAGLNRQSQAMPSPRVRVEFPQVATADAKKDQTPVKAAPKAAATKKSAAKKVTGENT